jgi:two-component system CheB/CheR fusion protein
LSARKGTAELRRRAESRLAELHARDERASSEDAKRLLHELRVHQIELEMQNEELVASRFEAEALLQRYSELFDFAPIGFFHVAVDGTIARSNFAGARLLGLDRAALARRTLGSFVEERDRRSFEGLLASVLTKSEPDVATETGEFAFHANGDDLVVRVTGALLDGTPQPSALLAVEDVTARREAEAALREEARRKDEFLAALSHELRNPLAPIRNALSILQRLPPGSEKAPSALAIADRQVAHLTRVVDDLLDVTRIARGKVLLRREVLDLVALVRSAVEDHRGGFEARGVHLGCHSSVSALWVEADASRLAQVSGNLLGNALKFTNPGDAVEVSLGVDDDAAVLRVRDSGVGMEPELVARLFEPFSQGAQTLDRSRGGLGLGLAMVKGLVELHGGTVDGASAGPGRGAEFTVRLPRVGIPREVAPEGGEAAAPRPQRVLIIEDNADAGESLKALLELRGHEVRVATDGQSGIFAARAFRPDVVLCDIGLPGMSGFDVARALRSEDSARGPFLVALSGYASPEAIRCAEESGFDGHVAKPATVQEIERLVGQASRFRARRGAPEGG